MVDSLRRNTVVQFTTALLERLICHLLVFQLNETELCGANHNCTAGVSAAGSTTLACLVLNDGCGHTQLLMCQDTLSVNGLLPLWIY